MGNRTNGEKVFNQHEYQKKWDKENMKSINVSYKTEFVESFREALKVLGLKQSDVIRKAMQAVIDEAEKSSQEQ
ncbi:hypothetical protein [Dubosiella newyorkensis]|uniref:hypothetical protein n=1 Tax=Dubosiella newyorkensis TaxID=1862672 RepID=UPI000335EC2F|nr:hypothetical protein [Dubosiella newyorkensis]EOS60891.1 hypothetical protein C815_00899 [Firmicutes bacterium M10-2]